MIFTQEDKLKLASNVAAMADYIKENIQPRVDGEIEVHFGGKYSNIRTGSVTDVCHLKVTSEHIEYAIKFGNYDTFESKAVERYAEEMLDFVKNWFDIKSRLNTAVQNQEDDRKAIYNFKV